MRPGVVRGPDDLYCPFWRQKMAKVCHTCPFWQQLRGVNPQTGEPVPDEWNCSLGHITKLLLENAQQARQAGASMDKVATEVHKVNQIFSVALETRDTKLIEQ